MFLGDTETGRSWHEENDVYGWVGRSVGPIKVPILLRIRKSRGGPAIMDNCIVRLLVDGREVYRHPNYKMPDIEIFEVGYDEKLPWEARLDGEAHARFETREKAQRWADFMRGFRMIK